MASPLSAGSRRSWNGFEDDEHRAEVGAVGVQHERLARDGRRVWATPGRLEGDLLDRVGHLERALQRGGVGQLDVDQQVALVLLGMKPVGDAA